jgi:hypothetical protein
MIDAEQRRGCGCGCGGVPRLARSRFLRGHNRRGGEQQESLCAYCDQPFPHKPSVDRTYCSRAHQYAAMREIRRNRDASARPRDAFGRFVFDRWKASGHSLSAFSSGLALSPMTIARLLSRGSRPTQRTLDALRRALGPELPSTPTAEEQKASRFRRMNLQKAGNFNPKHLAAIRRGAEKRRGRRRAPEAVAKGMATMLSRGTLNAGVPGMLASVRSQTGRARAALIGHLNGCKHPSPELLGRWAEKSAQRLDLSVEVVRAIWRPYLQQRGLANAAGRPRPVGRHRVIEELMAQEGLTPAGRVPRRFWARALEAIENEERRKAPSSPESLRLWWVAHKRSCLSCLSPSQAKDSLPNGKEIA